MGKKDNMKQKASSKQITSLVTHDLMTYLEHRTTWIENIPLKLLDNALTALFSYVSTRPKSFKQMPVEREFKRITSELYNTMKYWWYLLFLTLCDLKRMIGSTLWDEILRSNLAAMLDAGKVRDSFRKRRDGDGPCVALTKNEIETVLRNVTIDNAATTNFVQTKLLNRLSDVDQLGIENRVMLLQTRLETMMKNEVSTLHMRFRKNLEASSMWGMKIKFVRDPTQATLMEPANELLFDTVNVTSSAETVRINFLQYCCDKTSLERETKITFSSTYHCYQELLRQLCNHLDQLQPEPILSSTLRSSEPLPKPIPELQRPVRRIHLDNAEEQEDEGSTEVDDMRRACANSSSSALVVNEGVAEKLLEGATADNAKQVAKGGRGKATGSPAERTAGGGRSSAGRSRGGRSNNDNVGRLQTSTGSNDHGGNDGGDDDDPSRKRVFISSVDEPRRRRKVTKSTGKNNAEDEEAERIAAVDALFGSSSSNDQQKTTPQRSIPLSDEVLVSLLQTDTVIRFISDDTNTQLSEALQTLSRRPHEVDIPTYRPFTATREDLDDSLLSVRRSDRIMDSGVDSGGSTIAAQSSSGATSSNAPATTTIAAQSSSGATSSNPPATTIQRSDEEEERGEEEDEEEDGPGKAKQGSGGEGSGEEDEQSFTAEQLVNEVIDATNHADQKLGAGLWPTADSDDNPEEPLRSRNKTLISFKFMSGIPEDQRGIIETTVARPSHAKYSFGPDIPPETALRKATNNFFHDMRRYVIKRFAADAEMEVACREFYRFLACSGNPLLELQEQRLINIIQRMGDLVQVMILTDMEYQHQLLQWKQKGSLEHEKPEAPPGCDEEESSTDAPLLTVDSLYVKRNFPSDVLVQLKQKYGHGEIDILTLLAHKVRHERGQFPALDKKAKEDARKKTVEIVRSLANIALGQFVEETFLHPETEFVSLSDACRRVGSKLGQDSYEADLITLAEFLDQCDKDYRSASLKLSEDRRLKIATPQKQRQQCLEKCILEKLQAVKPDHPAIDMLKERFETSSVKKVSSLPAHKDGHAAVGTLSQKQSDSVPSASGRDRKQVQRYEPAAVAAKTVRTRRVPLPAEPDPTQPQQVSNSDARKKFHSTSFNNLYNPDWLLRPEGVFQADLSRWCAAFSGRIPETIRGMRLHSRYVYANSGSAFGADMGTVYEEYAELIRLETFMARSAQLLKKEMQDREEHIFERYLQFFKKSISDAPGAIRRVHMRGVFPLTAGEVQKFDDEYREERLQQPFLVRKLTEYEDDLPKTIDGKSIVHWIERHYVCYEDAVEFCPGLRVFRRFSQYMLYDSTATNWSDQPGVFYRLHKSSWYSNRLTSLSNCVLVQEPHRLFGYTMDNVPIEEDRGLSSTGMPQIWIIGFSSTTSYINIYNSSYVEGDEEGEIYSSVETVELKLGDLLILSGDAVFSFGASTTHQQVLVWQFIPVRSDVSAWSAANDNDVFWYGSAVPRHLVQWDNQANCTASFARADVVARPQDSSDDGGSDDDDDGSDDDDDGSDGKGKSAAASGRAKRQRENDGGHGSRSPKRRNPAA